MTNFSQISLKELIHLSVDELRERLWNEAPDVRELLKGCPDLYSARERLFSYLNDLERSYFNILSDEGYKDMHIIDRNNAKECIRILKNIIRSENEQLTGFSALKGLHDLARERSAVPPEFSRGFLTEFIFLFHGAHGRFAIEGQAEHLDHQMKDLAQVRSGKLDHYAALMTTKMESFRKGDDPDQVINATAIRDKILKHYKATESDWHDYRWQMKHIISDLNTLERFVQLNAEEVAGICAAEKLGIPFQITPHYLTMFNAGGMTRHDRVVRAQVIPGLTYCENISRNRSECLDMDFMGEKSTSPIEGITRRYPHIVILKPFDSCPQICVYCQRNWEIKGMDEAGVTSSVVRKAIDWIAAHPTIREVLITGGDPLTLTDRYFGTILAKVAAIPHIERIRIGTRTLVTMPQRFTQNLIDLLAGFHIFGKREVCIVTHFESPMEITPATLEAINRIRKAGMSIYNQQVFTYYNSRKFETCYLRKVLKLSGIDPYYSFNTKGKDETIDFRVPIARIEQERKEEARMLPGIVRTDEFVFNVPKLGKSHLRAWQDHEPIMVLGDGSRIYRFYPWESKINLVEDYLYTDLPIFDYLARLDKDGEDVEEYRSIWYYF